jgi:hypothetical protein
LRNKIDKGFDPPLILTKWGEGYMLRNDDSADEAGELVEAAKPRVAEKSGRDKK